MKHSGLGREGGREGIEEFLETKYTLLGGPRRIRSLGVATRADAVVIGAGVVGLACAAELARRGHGVTVLERHGAVGQEASSRNSEVVHAGLYYPEGSLKARACVEGRRLLYDRCVREGIGHRKLGKLVVAVEPGETAQLEALAERARANDAGDVRLLDAGEVAEREHRIRAVAALHSPETGIVDAHGLMSSLHAELEARGGAVAFHTRVRALSQRSRGGWSIETEPERGGERFTLEAEHVVNAAGLAADHIAALAGVDVEARGWRLHPCKGDYFSVAPALGTLANALVYPLPPGDGGLGIHLTLDLGGRARLGPDATYLAAPEIGRADAAIGADAAGGVLPPAYRVAPAKAAAFAEAAGRYLPELRPEHLAPEMAGIRPKLQGPGEGFRDFVVEEAPPGSGLVHLLGIESPGLTAALALASHAADALGSGRLS